MKIFFVLLAMFASIPCFAIVEEDEISKPIHYAMVPQVAAQLGVSSLSGSNSANSGFSGGVGFRFSRDGLFFTPNLKLGAIVGLDKSPLTMWSFGFICGGRIQSAGLDLFAGLDDLTMIAYQVNSAAIVKGGMSFDLGQSDFQIYIDAFYGVFSEGAQLTPTTQLNQNFPYVGGEVGIQLPIDL